MPVSMVQQFTDGTLLGAGGSVTSPWMDTGSEETLAVTRTSSGGTYQLDVEWSRDRATVDVTETVATTNNGRTFIDVSMPYARIRVRNTDGLTAFTAHRTTVCSR